MRKAYTTLVFELNNAELVNTLGRATVSICDELSKHKIPTDDPETLCVFLVVAWCKRRAENGFQHWICFPSKVRLWRNNHCSFFSRWYCISFKIWIISPWSGMDMVESWRNSIIFRGRISETSLHIDDLFGIMFRWVSVAFCYLDGRLETDCGDPNWGGVGHLLGELP